jgi:hypothetical protein
VSGGARQGVMLRALEFDKKIANFSPSIPTLDLTSATLLPDTMAMKTSGLLANRSRTFFVSAVFNVIKPFIVVLNNLRLRQ